MSSTSLATFFLRRLGKQATVLMGLVLGARPVYPLDSDGYLPCIQDFSPASLLQDPERKLQVLSGNSQHPFQLQCSQATGVRIAATSDVEYREHAVDDPLVILGGPER